MESKNFMGVYLGKETATVVCIKAQDKNVLGCFSVSIEQTDDSNFQLLSDLIAEGCAKKQMRFSDVSVALDCTMFMQHNIHSEFKEIKQIASTIRFDTEEALASDASDIAITFEITSNNETGSELAVFTAKQKVLSNIILSLKNNNIDPVAIQPDVNCLARFLHRKISSPEEMRPFFCILSQRNGYFIVPPAEGFKAQPLVRTFLISQTQNRNELLKKQLPLTTAPIAAEEQINLVKVFDSTDSVDCSQLEESLGIKTEEIDLTETVTELPEVLADCNDKVDFIIAFGAALSCLEKTKAINFRDDFMPYQGKKIRLQKTIKFLSVSLTVLMLAAGLYFQSKLLKKMQPIRLLRSKFAKEYSVVMSGKKIPAKSSPLRKLQSELRRIEDVKSGQLSATGEKSIAAKLTLVLEAFNNCAKATRLEIDKVSITPKSIRITGSTSTQKDTLRLFSEIKKNKLEILSTGTDTKGGRGNFNITLAPKI